MTRFRPESSEHLLPTYDRLDVQFERGEGVYLHDSDGNRYIDTLAGIAVNVLGYRHPKLLETGREAVGEIHHLSNLFEIPAQETLAETLSDLTFGTRAFFGNSGAEAIEAAIKFSRKHSYRFGDDSRTILSATNSFHGRTLGALAATGQKKYREGFGPLPEGFDYVPFNDIDALERRMNEDVCAVLLEPIQGEGGIIAADQDYLQAVRELCDERGILMIVDEIQSGIGRTGQFLAVQNHGVQPDLVTLAKGLAGGFPIGALLVDDSLDSGLQSGDHASTFGGNPFVSAMACEVLTQIQKENLLENARTTGDYFRDGLKSLADTFEAVGDPRGMGLMLGLPLSDPLDASEVLTSALDRGLIVGTGGDNALRFVPPLIITKREVDEALERLEETLKQEG